MNRIVLILAFFAFLSSLAYPVTDIASCQVINTPGAYALTQNLTSHNYDAYPNNLVSGGSIGGDGRYVGMKITVGNDTLTLNSVSTTTITAATIVKIYRSGDPPGSPYASANNVGGTATFGSTTLNANTAYWVMLYFQSNWNYNFTTGQTYPNTGNRIVWNGGIGVWDGISPAAASSIAPDASAYGITNISFAPLGKSCLVINNSSVTINGNGYSIKTDANSENIAGITVNSESSVVENITVFDWCQGVLLNTSGNLSSLKNINVSGSCSDYSTIYGVRVLSSQSNISNVIFKDTSGKTGAAGIQSDPGSNGSNGVSIVGAYEQGASGNIFSNINISNVSAGTGGVGGNGIAGTTNGQAGANGGPAGNGGNVYGIFSDSSSNTTVANSSMSLIYAGIGGIAGAGGNGYTVTTCHPVPGDGGNAGSSGAAGKIYGIYSQNGNNITTSNISISRIYAVQGGAGTYAGAGGSDNTGSCTSAGSGKKGGIGGSAGNSGMICAIMVNNTNASNIFNVSISNVFAANGTRGGPGGIGGTGGTCTSSGVTGGSGAEGGRGGDSGTPTTVQAFCIVDSNISFYNNSVWNIFGANGTSGGNGANGGNGGSGCPGTSNGGVGGKAGDGGTGSPTSNISSSFVSSALVCSIYDNIFNSLTNGTNFGIGGLAGIPGAGGAPSGSGVAGAAGAAGTNGTNGTALTNYNAFFSSSTTSVSFYRNTINGTRWINNQGSTNVFNTSATGNKYVYPNGSNSWTTYNISSADGTTWATTGTNRPFNSSLSGGEWLGNGNDYRPYTDVVLNLPPVISSISFTSGNYRGDSFVASCSATDPESGNVTYYYKFQSQIGVVLQNFSSNTTYSICSSDTACNKTIGISVVCNASDGTYNSTASASRAILNSAPSTPTTDTLTPASPKIGENFTMGCSGSTDIDPEDTVAYYLRPYDINDTAYRAAFSTSTQYNLATPSDSHDNFRTDCYASDGANTSATLTGTTIRTVANTAPTTSAPSITPNPAYESSTLTCNAGSFTDLDGDSAGTHTWKWYDASGLIAGQTTSTLANTSFSKGSIIVCEQTPVDDYTLAGTPVNSTAVTISDTSPSSALVGSYSDASNAHWFSFNATVTDADGGTDITASNITTTLGACVQVSNGTSGTTFWKSGNCTSSSSGSAIVSVGFTDASGAYAQASGASHVYPNNAPTVSISAVANGTNTHSFTYNTTITDLDGLADQNYTLSGSPGSCINISNSSNTTSIMWMRNCTATSPATATITTNSTDLFGTSAQASTTNAYPDLMPSLTQPTVIAILYVNSTATCAVGIFSDPNGDTENTGARAYNWYKNGAQQAGTSATLVLNTISAAKNDNISCRENATATTWTASIATNISANVTILNSVPVINSSRLSPATAYILTNILGYCNATDLNGDTVLYNYTLYMNGTANATGSFAASAQNIERNVANFTNFTKGTNLTLECMAYDGANYSTRLNSSKLTISNTAPTINTTMSFSNSTTLHQFNATVGIYDPDGANDTVVTNVSTTLGNCSIARNTTVTNFYNATATCNSTSQGTATITIGFTDASGAYVQASSANGYQNHAPTTSISSITNLTATHSFTYNTTITDLDGLTDVSYAFSISLGSCVNVSNSSNTTTITFARNCTSTSEGLATIKTNATDAVGANNYSTAANTYPSHPELTAPTISPTNPTVADTVTCVNGTFSDGGSTENTTNRTWVWYMNGTSANITTHVFVPSTYNYSKGTNLSCRETTSGNNWTSFQVSNSSANVTINNSAPLASAPTSISTSSDYVELNCTGSDADGWADISLFNLTATSGSIAELSNGTGWAAWNVTGLFSEETFNATCIFNDSDEYSASATATFTTTNGDSFGAETQYGYASLNNTVTWTQSYTTIGGAHTCSYYPSKLDYTNTPIPFALDKDGNTTNTTSNSTGFSWNCSGALSPYALKFYTQPITLSQTNTTSILGSNSVRYQISPNQTLNAVLEFNFSFVGASSNRKFFKCVLNNFTTCDANDSGLWSQQTYIETGDTSSGFFGSKIITVAYLEMVYATTNDGPAGSVVVIAGGGGYSAPPTPQNVNQNYTYVPGQVPTNIPLLSDIDRLFKTHDAYGNILYTGYTKGIPNFWLGSIFVIVFFLADLSYSSGEDGTLLLGGLELPLFILWAAGLINYWPWALI